MEKYVSVRQFADFHQITITLLHEFAEFGLINIQEVENEPCIVIDSLDRYERAIRLHKELGVNKEGIEIILEMRNKIEQLQNELNNMHRKLQKYEQLKNLLTDRFYDID